MTTTQRLAEIKDIHKARGRLPSVMEQVISDLSWLIARVEELDRALQSLTPGGSEFVGDAERCVKFVRDRKQAQHQRIIELTERLKLAAHCSQAEPAPRPPGEVTPTDAG